MYLIILFWNVTLHVSDDLFVHHQEFRTVCTATGICWHMPVVVYIVLNSWWWTEISSETCKVSFQNKIIWYTAASSWFYYRNNFKRCLNISSSLKTYLNFSPPKRAVINAEICCIKWRLILKVDLRKTVCVLFCLIAWIHKGMCEQISSDSVNKDDDICLCIIERALAFIFADTSDILKLRNHTLRGISKFRQASPRLWYK